MWLWLACVRHTLSSILKGPSNNLNGSFYVCFCIFVPSQLEIYRAWEVFIPPLSHIILNFVIFKVEWVSGFRSWTDLFLKTDRDISSDLEESKQMRVRSIVLLWYLLKGLHFFMSNHLSKSKKPLEAHFLLHYAPDWNVVLFTSLQSFDSFSN